MSRMFELLRQSQRDEALLKRAAPSSTSHSKNFEILLRSGMNEQLLERVPSAAALKAGFVPAPSGIPRGEAFKIVQQLYLAPGCPSPGVLVFCAVEHGHERGWIGSKVAEQLASDTQASTCIVDANITNPSLHTYFGVENRDGFKTLLSEAAPVKSVAQPVGQDGLWLIPAGELSSSRAQSKLSFERLGARLNELRRSFHYVLVDAPPSGESLTPYLASMADGVVIIVEQSFTPRQAVRELKEEIESAGARVLGVVMHRRPLSLADRPESRRVRPASKPAEPEAQTPISS
jgi:hypothetical protein